MWRRVWLVATLLTMPATSSFVLRCAAVVLAAVLLAGCTGEAAPSPTAPTMSSATSGSPTEAPSASSTTEPEIERITTPPAVPVDLKTPGQVGSKAAVEYFLATYAYLTATGDSQPFESSTTATCDFCQGVAAETVKVYEAGGRIDGDIPSIVSSYVDEKRSTTNRHVWNTAVQTTAVKLLDVNGAVVFSDGSTTKNLGIVAVWDGASWSISTVVDAPES